MMRLLSCIFLIATVVAARAQETKPIDKYVVDVTAGAVSAGTLIGVAKTAITEVHTSQDLVLALQPLTSSSSTSKNGFGLALTPFRTTIVPMDYEFYKRSVFTRALGSTTLSYAENTVTVGAIKYRKNAWSVDLSAFVDERDDPVFIGQSAADTVCNARTIELGQYAGRRQEEVDTAKVEVDRLAKIKEPLNSDEQKKLQAARDKANDSLSAAKSAWEKASSEAVGYLVKCVAEQIKAVKWNAPRWQFSTGGIWGRPDDGQGQRQRAGTYATLNVLLKAGPSGAVYLSLRRSWNELDFKTFNDPTLLRKSSTLAAARYTYGSQDDNGNLKALGEVSNAKSDSQTSNNSVFKYALGIDKRIAKGVWLEFRLGKARAFDNGAQETTGLLNLNIGAGSLSSLLAGK